MRIAYFGNNRLGLLVLKHLRDLGEDVVCLVVHPASKAKYRDELVSCFGGPKDRVFEAGALRDKGALEAIRALAPHIGLSVMFGYILREELLSIFPRGVINLHTSYLPYNRGAYPNVWSIVEGTPAGVTIHYMDSGVDTGDILARRKVPVDPVDTGQSLYYKLERAMLNLFKETWPKIKAGEIDRTPQSRGEGSYHSVRDVEKIDRIDLDRLYTGRELIDILRARTFSPYPGAYFESGGRRVYLRLKLVYEEDLA